MPSLLVAHVPQMLNKGQDFNVGEELMEAVRIYLKEVKGRGLQGALPNERLHLDSNIFRRFWNIWNMWCPSFVFYTWTTPCFACWEKSPNVQSCNSRRLLSFRVVNEAYPLAGKVGIFSVPAAPNDHLLMSIKS